MIDPATLSGPIKFGATVKLVDEDTDEERTFQIVGEPEADLERGLLNISSPLARALIGKEPGDSIEVRTPGGEKSYEVLSVDMSDGQRSAGAGTPPASERPGRPLLAPAAPPGSARPPPRSSRRSCR